jgi:hypothetical protein
MNPTLKVDTIQIESSVWLHSEFIKEGQIRPQAIEQSYDWPKGVKGGKGLGP